MNIIMKSLGEITPYEKNAQKHNETQINNIAESIKQHGFVHPIVIDKNNVIVIGHFRLMAAKQLKMKEVPCVCVEDLTEEEVNDLRIIGTIVDYADDEELEAIFKKLSKAEFKCHISTL